MSSEDSPSIATVYEKTCSGRRGFICEDAAVPVTPLPEEFVREDNGLPELSELDIARHYLALAQRNFGVDSGFYPLGSCTMKYNPRINEKLAKLPGFTDGHPQQSSKTVQGNLQLMHELQLYLAELGGFDAVSLQPSAGAHGELTALLMVRAWHTHRGDSCRTKILVPDTAHGTNPASSAMAGYDIVEIPSDARGNIDFAAVCTACADDVAAIMLTNPNTLGLFDENIEEVTRVVHDCGALVYGDGANMNALAGVIQPARTGIDLMHYNLHKTFGTPHGGGGPGAGPLAVTSDLAAFLPGPVVVKRETDGIAEYVTSNPARSIGRMSHHFGNFAVFVRAYCYIRGLGASGLRKNALHSVLNANYLRTGLRDCYHVPYDRTNMHEFVCEGQFEGSSIRALDISKRLMDAGIHPPTNYFPLVVHEALMIEPTECESRESLDEFIDAMRKIASDAIDNPKLLQQAPHTLPVGRLDEVYAARRLKVQEFM